jgi:two-component system, NtrC family, sensor kinase
MGRRAKPAKGKAQAKRPLAGKLPKGQGAKVRDLEKRLAEALKREAGAVTREAEAQEQQAATAEILRVISRSPTDIQPVLGTIATSAARLCESFDALIFRVDGDRLRLVAHHGSIPLGTVGEFTVPLDRGTLPGRSALDGRTIHVADLQAEAAEFPEGSEVAQRMGFRTALTIPLMREGIPIGVLALRRTEIRLFSERQIDLLDAFADQAVIAIENVRLFKELEARNADLTEALERQTATSEILKVISSSPTNVQPVFDAIVTSAVQLCRARIGAVFQFDGQMLHFVAHHNFTPAQLATLRSRHPRPPQRDAVSGRAILNQAVVQIEDVMVDPEYKSATGWRSMVAVPMVREDKPIGVIVINRAEPGAFTDKQIALLQTFADQAVIAIENVRLFTELQARTGELTRSVEQLTALGEVGRAVSSTLDLETVLTTIVSRAVELSKLDGGVVFEYEEATEEFVHRAATETGGALAEARRATRVQKGEGVVGRTAITLEPVQVPDITVPGAHESRLRENLIESGVRAILAVPMVREGRLIGSLVVSRNHPGNFPIEAIELLRTFATQSALAIQNARLFREIADKSRQLEAASRHKSEFLANMSHELRTPLNAIIGFSEVLVDRMFGELNEKQDEYLKDIYASGQHLLSLINDILDLSKIEAGRMELEAADFDLPSAIDNALTLVRERASRRGITLGHSVDERLGPIRGDERKVKQVLLNLLSNALKFTLEGGRIDVSTRVHDEVAEVSVTDTGVGIALEDQEAVFEEFRQVGTADKKVEGTGLGLALSRKFIELHGGRIWVKSQVGHGSTFTFTLPVRRED